MKPIKIKTPGSDAALRKMEKVLAAEQKIVDALRPLRPVARVRVLKAAAILHGVELWAPPRAKEWTYD